MDNDLVYLDRRAGEERCAARDSVHANAREIHLELAQAYEFRVFLLKQMDAPKSAPLQFEVAPNKAAREPRRVANSVEKEFELQAPRIAGPSQLALSKGGER